MKGSRFDVIAASGLVRGECAILGSLLANRRTLVVTTPSVDRLYGARLKSLLREGNVDFAYEVMVLGERRKQMATVEDICSRAARHGIDRRGVFVAVGGGVCSDVVTFAASMIRRGIDHIRVPTTLIGQVDAGIGLKGAVNFEGLKSFVGCFHPPAAVLLDDAFLATLPLGAVRQGLAEILKMALILDARLFEQLDACALPLLKSRFQSPQPQARAIVHRAVQLMLAELQANPFEDRTFERRVDMGHTFSPTLEALSHFRLSHGDAVAIDMALSCVIAVELGLMDAVSAEDFIGLLLRLGLPMSSPLLTLDACENAVQSVIAHRGGQLNLVVPRGIGVAEFIGADKVDARLLESALHSLRSMEKRLRAQRSFRTAVPTTFADRQSATALRP